MATLSDRKITVYAPHRITEAIALHSREYQSCADETYGRNASCSVCHTSYPCETRELLEDALDF
jgi:hypothetical protein